MSVQTSEIKRQCYGCSSIETYIDRKGNAHWYGNGTTNLWLCEKCDNKYVKNPKWHPITHPKTNPITSKKWNPINGPKFSARRIAFRDKGVYLSYNPRIGVCNLCRAVVGMDCQRTHIHHERYVTNDPSAFTIEVCPKCHRYRHHNRI